MKTPCQRSSRTLRVSTLRVWVERRKFIPARRWQERASFEWLYQPLHQRCPCAGSAQTHTPHNVCQRKIDSTDGKPSNSLAADGCSALSFTTGKTDKFQSRRAVHAEKSRSKITRLRASLEVTTDRLCTSRGPSPTVGAKSLDNPLLSFRGALPSAMLGTSFAPRNLVSWSANETSRFARSDN
jgi:hypothetical protein